MGLLKELLHGSRVKIYSYREQTFREVEKKNDCRINSASSGVDSCKLERRTYLAGEKGGAEQGKDYSRNRGRADGTDGKDVSGVQGVG